MFKALVLSFWVAAFGIACHSGWGSDPKRPPHCPSAEFSCSPQPVPAPSDAVQDLANRSSVLLGLYQGEIIRYFERHNRLPARLEDANPSNKPAVDAWGRQVRYLTVSEAYELRSAGADSQLETPDDIYFVAHATRRRPCILVVAGRVFDHADGDAVCAPLLRGLRIRQ